MKASVRKELLFGENKINWLDFIASCLLYFVWLFLVGISLFLLFYSLLLTFKHIIDAMADSKHPQVIFCNDSPKRVLVSVIKTTPIKPKAADSLMPTSPGFSDFMVYPWRWGENAHNVTLSPGSGSGAASPGRSSSAPAEVDSPSGDHLKVLTALFIHLIILKATLSAFLHPSRVEKNTNKNIK